MLLYRNIGNLILEPATTIMRPLYMYVGRPTVVYRHLLFSSQIAIDSQTACSFSSSLSAVTGW